MRDTRGFAVPMVLMMMLAAMVIAAGASIAAIAVQNGTVRDQRSKSGLSAAESGLSDAILRYNLTAAPACTDWCAAVGPTSTVNGGSFTFWVNPPGGTVSTRCAASAAPSACMEVVSSGTVNGVSRRVDATATSASGQVLFGDAAVKSQNGISMDSNAKVHSAAATNGDITLASNAQQCGHASVGIGRALTKSGNAGYFSDPGCTLATTDYSQQALNLPPVNQGDAPSNNDDSRFFALDPVSGNKADACWNGIKADGTAGTCGARELNVKNNSAVTLGGSIYSLCKLTMASNSKLYITAGADVAIYFDTPEACGYPSGATQMQLDSNTRISPATTAPTSVALLFVGSTALATNIDLNSNTDANALCQQNFVVYAPLTDITMNSNSDYCGALAGKTVHLDSNAEILTGSGTGSFTLPNTAAYYTVDPNGYVECSAAAATPPNQGC